MVELKKMGRQARECARFLRNLDLEVKDRTLHTLADQIVAEQDFLLAANTKDVIQARNGGLPPALLERLRLDEPRLLGIADDVRRVAALKDPVGEIFDSQVLPNGLTVHKQRVPLGVLAVIYESRPNVTIDVASLAIKSGNAVILRGGKETLHSNSALVQVIHHALETNGIPLNVVQFIDSSDRGLVMELLQMNDAVDMLIPRGGTGLHEFCRENSLIPVITGGIGICHLFVDESADQSAALRIIQNAKVQRPTVCNALDTVLVHRAIAGEFVPTLVNHLGADGVQLRMDPEALQYAVGLPGAGERVTAAGTADFDTEWLSLVLGVHVVSGLDEAVAHIEAHSTGHSDGILTNDEENARRFTQEVDSAAVYVNASTRFTDGAQLGLGAEVAISTQRFHARGPMALEALTTYKWVIQGKGHIRPD
jgi:glutamate-5-semialdehyde dehydrogenase